MATYDHLGQIAARAELRRRGLIVKGLLQVLRDRLSRDDTRGEFRGDLETAHLQYLKDGCNLLAINSKGSREEILERICFYNERKRQEAGIQA